MTKWQGGARGAILMVVLWTVGWGLGFGGLIELLVDPDGEILDVWPTAMAFPGFLGGIVFAGLFRIAEGRRGFGDVALARIAALGVVTGLVLGVLAVVTGISDGVEDLSLAPAEALGIATALGTVAAIGSAVFFRLLARWRRPAMAGR